MTWLSVAFRQGMCIFLVPNFFKWAKCRPLFVYLCPYLNRNVNVLQNSSINEKSVVVCYTCSSIVQLKVLTWYPLSRNTNPPCLSAFKKGKKDFKKWKLIILSTSHSRLESFILFCLKRNVFSVDKCRSLNDLFKQVPMLFAESWRVLRKIRTIKFVNNGGCPDALPTHKLLFSFC